MKMEALEGFWSSSPGMLVERSVLGILRNPQVLGTGMHQAGFSVLLWTIFVCLGFFSGPSPCACVPRSVPTCPPPTVSHLGSLAGLYHMDHIKGIL